MNTMWIGSLNQYAKSLARQTQWNLKKQSGDYNGHKKSLSDYVSFTKASNVLPGTEEKDNKLTAIMTKAQMGKKLSPDEWEYVRVKNPTMYIKLREAEREQKAYEEALKRCKTRDEAQRLHISKLGDIMTAAKNGDSSAIVRLNRIRQSMIAFTESEDYQKLPTEAELALEREAERQARQEALREEAETGQAEGKDEAFAGVEGGPDAGAPQMPGPAWKRTPVPGPIPVRQRNRKWDQTPRPGTPPGLRLRRKLKTRRVCPAITAPPIRQNRRTAGVSERTVPHPAQNARYEGMTGMTIAPPRKAQSSSSHQFLTLSK